MPSNCTFSDIFVFFVTAASFIEIISSLLTVAKREAILFLFGCSEVNSTNHLRASQSARAKSTTLYSLVWYTALLVYVVEY